MGAPVEGWDRERIAKEYGVLDRLLPYEHYRNGWMRPPGTTEDGIERQKLMLTAIIEKQDRITAEDVVRIWLRDIKPESEGMVSEPFESTLLAISRAGIPAQHIGRYCPWDGLVTMSRSCHGLGIINACDPESAVRDVYDVGLLYNTSVGDGLKWAAVVAAGIASALCPGSSVESVIGSALGTAHERIRRELARALEMADRFKEPSALRDAFYDIYNGKGVPYAHSWANEVVSKAFAVFSVTRGDPHNAIVASVNFGRDTDCLAAISGGLAGALSGGSTLRAEWIGQVDEATKKNIYTNSQRTLKETADGLHRSLLARVEKGRRWADALSGQVGSPS
jgi:ADP-ribosylglycohydrolase